MKDKINQDYKGGVTKDYLLRQGEGSNGIHWTKWKNMCISKSRVRMGFRDVELFNKAMLGKQGWRLLTQTESLIHQVLKAKYFPDCSFMETQLGNNPSYTWKRTWEVHDILEKSVRERVGNGQSIQI
ncbi:uncharacterized protein LOC111293360 [Durio zibethinus]|uniref:Uncharacterized protein LOC111293360 n=1 Tax=Durio zibethinus TaxID=66656 RepID=A0A6P5YNI2_DURZI|nr:uncharacterized protein LOC111293360 [Durio zibethinus]